MASPPAGRSARETPGYNRSMGLRRDSKPTDVYVPPAPGTTLQTSGRRIPLRHSDAPDYDAVSISDEAPRARRGRWLVLALLLAAALGVAAWRILG